MKRGILVLAALPVVALATYLGATLSQGQVVPPVPAPVIPGEITSYRDIVKKVLPAVVSVEAMKARVGRAGHELGDFLVPVDDDDPDRVGFGSGFVIDGKVVVTNNHVVEGADEIRIQTSRGKKLVSTKVRRDPKTDLAIVILDVKEPLPSLDFGDSETMEIGDRVLAVGAPFGLTGSVSHGIISGKGRSLKMNMYEDFLQTDAAINPGNSGGPLVNLEGKVIGINSAIKSRSGGFQGIGLAISSNLGQSIVKTLRRDGVVKRGYLGVGIRDMNEELAGELKVEQTTGVYVTRVYPDGPGEKAGLRTGDIIVKLGDRPIKDGRGLQSTVAPLALNKAVNVEVIREGKSRTFQVTVLEQPPAFGVKVRPEVPVPGKGAVLVEKAGMALADLSPALASALEYPPTAKGALVTEISRTGPAYKAGVEPGELITKVDKRTTSTAKAAAKALEEGSLKSGILLELRRPRGPSRQVTLRLR